MIKCDDCVFDLDGVDCSALTEYKINNCKFFKDRVMYIRDQDGFVKEREVPEDGKSKA